MSLLQPLPPAFNHPGLWRLVMPLTFTLIAHLRLLDQAALLMEVAVSLVPLLEDLEVSLALEDPMLILVRFLMLLQPYFVARSVALLPTDATQSTEKRMLSQL